MACKERRGGASGKIGSRHWIGCGAAADWSFRFNTLASVVLDRGVSRWIQVLAAFDGGPSGLDDLGVT